MLLFSSLHLTSQTLPFVLLIDIPSVLDGVEDPTTAAFQQSFVSMEKVLNLERLTGGQQGPVQHNSSKYWNFSSSWLRYVCEVLFCFPVWILCIIEKGTECFCIVNTFQMTASMSTIQS